MAFAARRSSRAALAAVALLLCLFGLKAETSSVAPFRLKAEKFSVAPFRLKAETFSVAPFRLKAETFSAAPFRLKAETFSVDPFRLKAETFSGAPFRLKAETFSAAPFRLKAETTRVEKRDGPSPESRRFRLQAEAHLRISGTRFLKPDGSVFAWRGITAFRLLEFVAHNREAEADAYLAWAASKKLNLVRVLVMADGLFKLSPADGQRALPRLLELARKHGLHVEVVALADTASIVVDPSAHIKAIGAICARYPNALLEIANEPVHPTQAKAIHDAAYLKSLAALVPAGVPISLGSVERGDGFAEGSYLTWHAPRSGPGGWPAQIAHGAALAQRFKKPVVNDEPMGAADQAVPGRRDNDPARFRQAGAASRRAGLGATFHYEGGLQARKPTTIEMACLDAWLAGLSAGR